MQGRRQRLDEVQECMDPTARKMRGPQDDKPLANSFVRKILRVTPCGSRFCGALKRSRKRKSIEMKILSWALENNCVRTSEGKSLFWDILRAKSLESRFCEGQSGSPECKLFAIKILAEVI
jgi:hypothetical protein